MKSTNKKEKQEKNSFDINVETFKDQGADSIFLSNSIKRPKKQDSSVQDKQILKLELETLVTQAQLEQLQK